MKGALIIVVCVGLFYLRRWVHDRAMHHPEWQTFDALDRLMQWAIVVSVVWIAVSLTFHTIELTSIIHELNTDATNVAAP